MKPSASRVPCQQSSRLTYSYPAAFMPLEAMASTAAFTLASETSQPKAYHVFQPIEGVAASSAPCAFALPASSTAPKLRHPSTAFPMVAIRYESRETDMKLV